MAQAQTLPGRQCAAESRRRPFYRLCRCTRLHPWNAGTKDVEYKVKMPVVQSITYSVRNTYIQKGNSYEVRWTLLRSPLAKSSNGSLRIEPYGKGQTLMCYTNLVVPITNLVAGLKNQALNEAKTTVRAIKAEAERRAAGKEA